MNHLVHHATQPPPVWREGVAMVVNHLRGCISWETGKILYSETIREYSKRRDELSLSSRGGGGGITSGATICDHANTLYACRDEEGLSSKGENHSWWNCHRVCHYSLYRDEGALSSDHI